LGVSLGSEVVEDVPRLLSAALDDGTEGVSGQGRVCRCSRCSVGTPSIATGSRRRRRRRRRSSPRECVWLFLIRGSTCTVHWRIHCRIRVGVITIGLHLAGGGKCCGKLQWTITRTTLLLVDVVG
jgi:hypothetical protein